MVGSCGGRITAPLGFSAVPVRASARHSPRIARRSLRSAGMTAERIVQRSQSQGTIWIFAGAPFYKMYTSLQCQRFAARVYARGGLSSMDHGRTFPVQE